MIQKNAASDHLQDNKKEQNEQDEFNAYANSVLEEWKAANRPTRLISHSIQKLQEHKVPKERFVEGIKLDTFSRLGFS